MGGGVCFVAVCRLVFAVHDLSVAILVSTQDILHYGTMTATIVMMSAALVQKKGCLLVFGAVGVFCLVVLFMRRERRRLKAKHLWVELDPQWNKLKECLFTRHVTNQSWDHLYARLFLNKFGSKQRFREAGYQGYDYHEVHGKWKQTRDWYERSAVAQSPSLLELSNHFLHFD